MKRFLALVPSVSSLISAAEQGDRSAGENLFELLYSELHRLAKRELARRGVPVTLSATTLLHQAYIEMASREQATNGSITQVTDIGRAMVTGNCADVGKVKGPILRGLTARAPYFHNGAAANLGDVVEFYNQRFNLNLTDQQKSDLVAFLQTL